ncbi:MAG: hypothetical protein HYZ42_11515, partial [Bacteroidetes bacterium]|nr:hypothetical protein [Bacteroidota bacterium]
MKLLFTNMALLAAILFSACGNSNNNPQTTTPTTQQNASHFCGTDSIIQVKLAKDPKFRLYMDKLMEQLAEWSHRNLKSEPVYTIPVVFHVVYKNNNEKIDRNKLITLLDWLNKDFRKANIYSTTIHPQFANLAANTNIQFCLAKLDTNGNATLGVDYTTTTRSNFPPNEYVFDPTTGGTKAWNTQKYMNVYVCDIIPGIKGY